MAAFRKSAADERLRSYDPYAHARVTIESTHNMIHHGFAYHMTHRVASLANAASLDGLLAVPAGVFPHMNGIIFSVSDSPCDILAYEGVTTSDDGTVVTPFNRNRSSANTPGLVATHTPTVTDLGTLIHDRYVPDAGGSGSNTVGAITPTFGEEWILAPATKYLIRLTNNSGGPLTISMEMLWYEMAYVENE